MIISKTDALAAIKVALATGGDFAEVFAEDSYSTSLNMIAGKMKDALSGRDHCAGIRIFKGTNSVYVYTNDTSKNGLIDAAKKAAAAIPKSDALGIDIVLQSRTYDNINKIAVPPRSVVINKKVQKVKDAYKAAKEYDKLISQVSV
ncbi:MAG: TldD/PmbA family protein, partial [Clostridiales bacterium]|nr:TldD/PmbA family protein [Clostridiales bacterium]